MLEAFSVQVAGIVHRISVRGFLCVNLEPHKGELSNGG